MGPTIMTLEIWPRFETALEKFEPKVLKSFAPPATREQIAQAELAVSAEFPPELVTAYLRHDGCIDDDNCYNRRIFSFNNWIGLGRMVSLWNMDREVEAQMRRKSYDNLSFPTYDSSWDELLIRPVAADPKWIPIGATNAKGSELIDLNPGPAGRHGQLIYNGCDIGVHWVAESLDHYLERLIELLERRVIYYDEGWTATATKKRAYDFSELL